MPITASRKKIVLIAGNLSHGQGAHEYIKTVRLLKALLEQSRCADRLEVAYATGGWPESDDAIRDADLLLFVTDGRDGHLYEDVPFVKSERRMRLMEACMARGCGLILLHFSTFFARAEGRRVLEWTGGYFEWQDEKGERNWYSKITGNGSKLALADRTHPIARGVAGTIELEDEIYWNMRFLPGDPRRTPIWTVPELQAEGEEASLVGWALERSDGGRSFVTSAGHRYTLWMDDSFRKAHLNAIFWAAGLDVPEGGVQSRYYTDVEVESLLNGPAAPARPLYTLLLSGNERHKWHNWERTEPLIKEILHEDVSVAVTSIFDPAPLAEWDLSAFDVILLNYCNWHDAVGLGLDERAKQNLMRFMEQGGGLVVLHFANGAFHYSLPEAGASDWPEYRRIVPRVWDHHGSSAHDNYGSFAVSISDPDHAITRGIGGFEVKDELYYNQAGDVPVHVLYTARSKNTGLDEPLAWTSEYRGGRVFQTLLGHDGESYRVPEVREMLRRAVRWAGYRIRRRGLQASAR
ncbi:ThuA domain-containing protein [Paenibacillus ginsengarvi]|uniref:ThuA-like domain-containing protein n=1 Tax=Paenibacillus ginsengarvi TaxID=400777 RepID=A0A3B0C6Z9_9BACL|nr:ThuA domain-containing protein [Paenibacillus ginsengarvi]RKN80501.1 hypothetical protein D7M11_20375 [Paenibacillus ginsengarvi]